MNKQPLKRLFNTIGILLLSQVAMHGAVVSWTNGAYTDNTVLSFAGTTGQVLYGVNLGGSALTTANGYAFQAGNSGSVTYVGFDIASPFLGGGSGTSTDTNFNSILGDANFFNTGDNTYTLNGLTAGVTYNVLFLMADTRTEEGIPGRSFIIGSESTTSSSQVYAFASAVPSLGGYALGTFTATGSTEVFNRNGTDGQLNGILVAAVPEPSTSAMLILAGLGAVALLHKQRTSSRS